MENKNLDIIQLIENNPITRFNSTYQSNFIEKIKNNFTETQQHLFITSFYCYLNYKKDNYIWKELAYTRKNDAKKH